MNPSFIFIFITLALTLPILAYSADVSNSFCSRTTHKPLCLSIINSDRRANLKTSPNGLVTILRDSALALAYATSSKISTLLKKATGHELASLKTCSAGYKGAIGLLVSADFEVISRLSYPVLIASIGGANDEPRDCELSFQEPPAVPSPISAENQRLRENLATALEIINIVVCNNPSFCSVS